MIGGEVIGYVFEVLADVADAKGYSINGQRRINAIAPDAIAAGEIVRLALARETKGAGNKVLVESITRVCDVHLSNL